MSVEIKSTAPGGVEPSQNGFKFYVIVNGERRYSSQEYPTAFTAKLEMRHYVNCVELALQALELVK